MDIVGKTVTFLLVVGVGGMWAASGMTFEIASLIEGVSNAMTLVAK